MTQNLTIARRDSRIDCAILNATLLKPRTLTIANRYYDASAVAAAAYTSVHSTYMRYRSSGIMAFNRTGPHDVQVHATSVNL